MTRLVAVPNVSEGRDATCSTRSGPRSRRTPRSCTAPTDADHHRAVFFLAGEPGRLHLALAAGAAEAAARIDLRGHDGLHPRVGALDVAPVVFLEEAQRGAAIAEALLAADAIGRAGHPRVPLRRARGRAHARRAAQGRARRARGARDAAGLRPGGAAPRRRRDARRRARAPLIAFNVALEPPATLADARAIAAAIRDRGRLPGVRALGLRLERQDVVQVSTNIEDHRAVTAAAVLDAVRGARGGRRRRAGGARAGGRARRLARRTSNCACRRSIEALLGR